MKKLIAISSILLSSFTVNAASVNIALDTNPDREKSGTYRYVDNLLQSLNKEGWETETFARGTIGGEDERLDQIRSGILDISLSKYSAATQFIPEMQVLQLPYTFANPDHQFAFFTKSDYLEKINKKLANEGMRIMAIVPTGGFLGIFNNKKPVHNVNDMKGLRMRALDPNQLSMFEMMGASGVVIPFSEVTNALQTGIADGYINPSAVPLMFGQTDLLKYFTDAKIIMSARLILASLDWWENLSNTEKAQFNAASMAAQKEVFQWVDESEAKHKKELTQAGIEVYEPTEKDIASFKAAIADMSKQVKEVSPERIAAIQAMISQYEQK